MDISPKKNSAIRPYKAKKLQLTSMDLGKAASNIVTSIDTPKNMKLNKASEAEKFGVIHVVSTPKINISLRKVGVNDYKNTEPKLDNSLVYQQLNSQCELPGPLESEQDQNSSIDFSMIRDFHKQEANPSNWDTDWDLVRNMVSNRNKKAIGFLDDRDIDQQSLINTERLNQKVLSENELRKYLQDAGIIKPFKVEAVELVKKIENFYYAVRSQRNLQRCPDISYREIETARSLSNNFNFLSRIPAYTATKNVVMTGSAVRIGRPIMKRQISGSVDIKQYQAENLKGLVDRSTTAHFNLFQVPIVAEETDPLSKKISGYFASSVRSKDSVVFSASRNNSVSRPLVFLDQFLNG